MPAGEKIKNDPEAGKAFSAKGQAEFARIPKGKKGRHTARVPVPGMVPSNRTQLFKQKKIAQNERAIARVTAATDLIADFNEKLLRRGLKLLDKELLDEPEVQILREATKMSMRLLDKQVPDLLSDRAPAGGDKLVQIVVGAAITRFAPKPDVIEIPSANGATVEVTDSD